MIVNWLIKPWLSHIQTHIQQHPFRFLLYLEWVILGLVALIEILPILPTANSFPVLSLSSILILSLMGLRLPPQRQALKILYTFLEISLVALSTLIGNLRLFPFFYLLIVIRSCLIFDLPGRIVVAVMTFVLFQVTLNYRFAEGATRLLSPVLPKQITLISLSFSAVFGVSLVFALLLMHTLLAERANRQQLAEANSQLRDFALKAEVTAALEERNRIAREIHDSLGHALTALNLQLEGALRLWSTNPAAARDFLTEAKKLGSTALKEVRQSVAALRRDPMEGLSLSDGILSLVRDVQSVMPLRPTCAIDIDANLNLPQEVKTSLYRIIQEALTNICKYAAASQVAIVLQSKGSRLHLTIQDDGKGFDVQQNRMGFGLQGMRERATALGGWLKVDSQPGSGCRIEAEIPLSASSATFQAEYGHKLEGNSLGSQIGNDGEGSSTIHS
ncbi:MAG: sensor histidine kinase [Cyanobacteriota bacterium]|nr:sensor histidine kinase [Cyanobacteriota bacterium]